MKKSLHASEWFLVLSLLAIMTSLVIVSQINVRRAESLLVIEEKSPQTVNVSIRGAVGKPAIYPVEVGTPLKTVLRKARPKPWANLKKIHVDQVVEESMDLFVEELDEVTIKVRGEVAEVKEVVLPAGSRICDLKSKVVLTKEADRGFFKRKKVLREGEIVEVPKKTVERNCRN